MKTEADRYCANTSITLRVPKTGWLFVRFWFQFISISFIYSSSWDDLVDRHETDAGFKTACWRRSQGIDAVRFAAGVARFLTYSAAQKCVENGKLGTINEHYLFIPFGVTQDE